MKNRKNKRTFWHKYLTDILIVIVVLSVFGSVSYAFFSLPRTDTLNDLRLVEATQVFDIHGELIAKLFEENRVVVPIQNMSPYIKQAIIANEDSRFYQHHGIDFIGIARAAVVNIRKGGIVEGGSTITQQLAKNLFLTQERTLLRKIKEVLLALMIERNFSKQEILQAYLNQIYFGEGAYGVEAASQVYFGKHAAELSLAESALLAGLPRGPSLYSPYSDLNAALRRRAVVLNGMVKEGYIDAGMAQAATNEEMRLAGKRKRIAQASYFLDYIANELVSRYGANRVYKGGLKIYTTLDLSIQRLAENVLGDFQGAVFTIDVRNGHILAMVGGKNYAESQVNRVTSQVRQPGSAFKPILYAAALNDGMTAASVIIDEPIDIGGYKPQNYDKKYLGAITLSKALRLSVNVVAVKLGQQIGIGKVLNLSKSMGISTLTPEDNNLSAALGGFTHGINLWELTTSYAAFANGGVLTQPVAILKVLDDTGVVLEQATTIQRRVLSPEVAYIITNMLEGVMNNGTGTPGNIGIPAAGKTGTTDNYVNAWFIGYTPEMVTGIFVGNDNHTPVGISGTQVAGLWGKMMIEATKSRTTTNFYVPNSIVVNIPICTSNGKYGGLGCQEIEKSAFIRGTEPKPGLVDSLFPWLRLPGLF